MELTVTLGKEEVTIELDSHELEEFVESHKEYLQGLLEEHFRNLAEEVLELEKQDPYALRGIKRTDFF